MYSIHVASLSKLLVNHIKFTHRRFSELNLSGLKLGKPVVDTLCKLAGSTTLSGLMLRSTGIGTVSDI